jgi:type II secretory pathway component PulJ
MNVSKTRACQGFSLIELMIALVAGMIVVGAVLAFTISSIRANSDFVKSTRLMQELRNTSDFVTAELKRAGYDESAMDYVANPTASAASLFAPILVNTSNPNANCVLYAYDRSGGRAGKVDGDRGELRGIRRTTATIGTSTFGVIEVAESTSTATPACDGASPDYSVYPVTCNTTSGWCPLSDPRTLNISALTIYAPTAIPVGNNTHGIQTIPAGSGFNAMQLRELQVTITGNLTNDASVTRTVRSNIKVRADCLRASVVPACTIAPQITP